jgi:hypothetical protein
LAVSEPVVLKSGSMFLDEKILTPFAVLESGNEDFGLPFLILRPATKVFEKEELLFDFKYLG